MRISFFVANKPREERIAQAMKIGAENRGFDFKSVPANEWKDHVGDFDVAISFGVKGKTRAIMDWCLENRRQFIYVDKGYLVRTRFLKVSVGGFQPLDYILAATNPDDRLLELVESGETTLPKKIQPSGNVVVWAGPSAKYCKFHGLGSPHEMASQVIGEIRQVLPDHEIVYKPKASWNGARPIEGSIMCQESERFAKEFSNKIFAYVSAGSNSALEVLLRGVPVVTLGQGITAWMTPVSIPSLKTIGQWPWDFGLIRRQMANIVYCQWEIEELASEKCWESIEGQLEFDRRSKGWSR